MVVMGRPVGFAPVCRYHIALNRLYTKKKLMQYRFNISKMMKAERLGQCFRVFVGVGETVEGSSVVSCLPEV